MARVSVTVLGNLAARTKYIKLLLMSSKARVLNPSCNKSEWKALSQLLRYQKCDLSQADLLAWRRCHNLSQFFSEYLNRNKRKNSKLCNTTCAGWIWMKFVSSLAICSSKCGFRLCGWVLFWKFWQTPIFSSFSLDLRSLRFSMRKCASDPVIRLHFKKHREMVGRERNCSCSCVTLILRDCLNDGGSYGKSSLTMRLPWRWFAELHLSDQRW